MQLSKRSAATLAAILILCAAGCGALDYLQLAVGAAEIALPLIGPAAGVDQATVTAVSNYLAATSQAITQAIDIENGTGTDAQKATQIVAAFAGIAAPIVPAKYQALANAIQQVAQYIAKYLATLPVPSSATASKTTALSSAEKTKASQIRARAQAVWSKTHR
jgi:hypothetical protein